MCVVGNWLFGRQVFGKEGSVNTAGFAVKSWMGFQHACMQPNDPAIKSHHGSMCWDIAAPIYATGCIWKEYNT